MSHRRRRPRTMNLDVRIEDINYKNIALLRQVTSSYFRILPAKRTGLHAKAQRKLAREIKRARTMALIPFTRV